MTCFSCQWELLRVGETDVEWELLFSGLPVGACVELRAYDLRAETADGEDEGVASFSGPTVDFATSSWPELLGKRPAATSTTQLLFPHGAGSSVAAPRNKEWSVEGDVVGEEENAFGLQGPQSRVVSLVGLRPCATYVLVMSLFRDVSALQCDGDRSVHSLQHWWVPLRTLSLPTYVRCMERSDNSLGLTVVRPDNTLPLPRFLTSPWGNATNGRSSSENSGEEGFAPAIQTQFGPALFLVEEGAVRLALAGRPAPSQRFEFHCRLLSMIPPPPPSAMNLAHTATSSAAFDERQRRRQHDASIPVGDSFVSFDDLQPETLYQCDVVAVELVVAALQSAEDARGLAPTSAAVLPPEEGARQWHQQAGSGLVIEMPSSTKMSPIAQRLSVPGSQGAIPFQERGHNKQQHDAHLWSHDGRKPPSTRHVFGMRSRPSFVATLPRVVALVESLTPTSAAVSVQRNPSPESTLTAVLESLTPAQRLGLLATGGADGPIAVIARIAKRRMARLMSLRRGSTGSRTSRSFSVGSVQQAQSVLSGGDADSEYEKSARSGVIGDESDTDDSDLSSSDDEDDDSDLDDVLDSNGKQKGQEGKKGAPGKDSGKGHNNDGDEDKPQRETGDILIIGPVTKEDPFIIDGLQPNSAYTIHYYAHALSGDELDAWKIRQQEEALAAIAGSSLDGNPMMTMAGDGANPDGHDKEDDDDDDDDDMEASMQRRNYDVDLSRYTGRSLLVTPNIARPLPISSLHEASRGGRRSSGVGHQPQMHPPLQAHGTASGAASGRTSPRAASPSAASLTSMRKSKSGISMAVEAANDGFIQNDVVTERGAHGQGYQYRTDDATSVQSPYGSVRALSPKTRSASPRPPGGNVGGGTASPTHGDLLVASPGGQMVGKQPEGSTEQVWPDTAKQDAMESIARAAFRETNPSVAATIRGITESTAELCFVTDFKRTADRLMYRRMHLIDAQGANVTAAASSASPRPAQLTAIDGEGRQHTKHQQRQQHHARPTEAALDPLQTVAQIPQYLCDQITRADIVSTATSIRRSVKFLFCVRILIVPRGEVGSDMRSIMSSHQSVLAMPKLSWDDIDLVTRRSGQRIEHEHKIRFRTKFDTHGLELLPPTPEDESAGFDRGATAGSLRRASSNVSTGGNVALSRDALQLLQRSTSNMADAAERLKEHLDKTKVPPVAAAGGGGSWTPPPPHAHDLDGPMPTRHRRASGDATTSRHAPSGSKADASTAALAPKPTYVEATVREIVFATGHSKWKLPDLPFDTRFVVSVCGMIAPERPPNYDELVVRREQRAEQQRQQQQQQEAEESLRQEQEHATESPKAGIDAGQLDVAAPYGGGTADLTSSIDNKMPPTTPSPPPQAVLPTLPAPRGVRDADEFTLSGSRRSDEDIHPFAATPTDLDGSSSSGTDEDLLFGPKLEWKSWTSPVTFMTNYVPKMVQIEYLDADGLRFSLSPKLSDVECKNCEDDPHLLAHAIGAHMQQALQMYVSAEISCVDDARHSRSVLLERDKDLDAYVFRHALKFDGRYQLKVRVGELPPAVAAKKEKKKSKSASRLTSIAQSPAPDNASVLASTVHSGFATETAAATGADGPVDPNADVEDCLNFGPYGPVTDFVVCSGNVLDVEEIEQGLRCYLHPPFLAGHKTEWSMRARKHKLPKHLLASSLRVEDVKHLRFSVRLSDDRDNVSTLLSSAQLPQRRGSDGKMHGSVVHEEIRAVQVNAFAMVGCGSTGLYHTYPVPECELRHHVAVLKFLRPDSYNVSVRYLVVLSQQLPAWRFGGRIQAAGGGGGGSISGAAQAAGGGGSARPRSRSATFEQPLLSTASMRMRSMSASGGGPGISISVNSSSFREGNSGAAAHDTGNAAGAGAARRRSSLHLDDVAGPVLVTPRSDNGNEEGADDEGTHGKGRRSSSLVHEDNAVVAVGRRGTLTGLTSGGSALKSPAPATRMSAVMNAMIRAEESVLGLAASGFRRTSFQAPLPKVVTALHNALKTNQRYDIGTGTVYRRHEALPLRVGEHFITLTTVVSAYALFDIFAFSGALTSFTLGSKGSPSASPANTTTLENFLSSSQTIRLREAVDDEPAAHSISGDAVDGDLTSSAGMVMPAATEGGEAGEGADESSPLEDRQLPPSPTALASRVRRNTLDRGSLDGPGDGHIHRQQTQDDIDLSSGEILLGMHECPYNDFAEPVFSRRGKPLRYPMVSPDSNIGVWLPLQEARMGKFHAAFLEDMERMKIHEAISQGASFTAVSASASTAAASTSASTAGGETSQAESDATSALPSSTATSTAASSSQAALTGLASHLLKRGGELSPWYQQFKREISNVQIEVTLATDASAKNATTFQYNPQLMSSVTVPALLPGTEYRMRLRVQGRFNSTLGASPNWSRWTLPIRITTQEKLLINTTFPTESTIQLRWIREKSLGAADPNEDSLSATGSSSYGGRDSEDRKRRQKSVTMEVRVVNGVADHRKYVPPLSSALNRDVGDDATGRNPGAAGDDSYASAAVTQKTTSGSGKKQTKDAAAAYLKTIYTNVLPYEVEVCLIDNNDAPVTAKRLPTKKKKAEVVVLQQCNLFVPPMLNGLKLKECYPGMKYLIRLRTTTNRDCDAAVASGTAATVSPPYSGSVLDVAVPSSVVVGGGGGENSQMSTSSQTRRRRTSLLRQFGGAREDSSMGVGMWSPKVPVSTLSDVTVTLLRLSASYCTLRIDKLAADLSSLDTGPGKAMLPSTASPQNAAVALVTGGSGGSQSFPATSVTPPSPVPAASPPPEGSDGRVPLQPIDLAAAVSRDSGDVPSPHHELLSRMSHYEVRCRPAQGWLTEEEYRAAYLKSKDRRNSQGNGAAFPTAGAGGTDNDADDLPNALPPGMETSPEQLFRWKRPTMLHTVADHDVMGTAKAGPIGDPYGTLREVTLNDLVPGVMYVMSIRPQIVGQFAGQWVDMLRFSTPLTSFPRLIGVCEDHVLFQWTEPLLRRVTLLNQDSARAKLRQEELDREEVDKESTSSHSSRSSSVASTNQRDLLSGDNDASSSVYSSSQGAENAAANAGGGELLHSAIPFVVSAVEITVSGKFLDPTMRRLGTDLNTLRDAAKETTVTRRLDISTRFRERLIYVHRQQEAQKHLHPSSTGGRHPATGLRRRPSYSWQLSGRSAGSGSSKAKGFAVESPVAAGGGSEVVTPFHVTVVPAPLPAPFTIYDAQPTGFAAPASPQNDAASSESGFDAVALNRNTGLGRGAERALSSSSACCLALQLLVENCFADTAYRVRIRYRDQFGVWSPPSVTWTALTHPPLQISSLCSGESYMVLRVGRLPRLPSSRCTLEQFRDYMVCEKDHRMILERYKDVLLNRILVVDRYGEDAGFDEDDDWEAATDEELMSREQLNAELDLIAFELDKLRGAVSAPVGFATTSDKLAKEVDFLHRDLLSRRTRRYKFATATTTASSSTTAPSSAESLRARGGNPNLSSRSPEPLPTPPTPAEVVSATNDDDRGTATTSLEERLGLCGVSLPVVDDDRLYDPSQYSVEVSVIREDAVDPSCRPSRNYLFGRGNVVGLLSSSSHLQASVEKLHSDGGLVDAHGMTDDATTSAATDDAQVKRESSDVVSVCRLRPATRYIAVVRVNADADGDDADEDDDVVEALLRESAPSLSTSNTASGASPTSTSDGGMPVGAASPPPAQRAHDTEKAPLLLRKRACSFFDPGVEVNTFGCGMWSDGLPFTTLPAMLVRCRAVGFSEMLFEVYRPLHDGELSVPTDDEYAQRQIRNGGLAAAAAASANHSSLTAGVNVESLLRGLSSSTYQLSVNGKHTPLNELLQFPKGERKLVHLHKLPPDSGVTVGCRSRFSLDEFLRQLEGLPGSAGVSRSLLRSETLAKRRKITFWSTWTVVLTGVRTLPPRTSVPVLYEARRMPATAFHYEGGRPPPENQWRETVSFWWSQNVDSVNHFPTEIQLDQESSAGNVRRRRAAARASQTTAETTQYALPATFLQQQCRLLQVYLDPLNEEMTKIAARMDDVVRAYRPADILSVADPRGLNALSASLISVLPPAPQPGRRDSATPTPSRGTPVPTPRSAGGGGGSETPVDPANADAFTGLAYEGAPSEYTFEVEYAEYWPDVKCFSDFFALGRFTRPFVRVVLPPDDNRSIAADSAGENVARCMFRVRARVEAPSAPDGCVRSVWSPVIGWKAPEAPAPVSELKVDVLPDEQKALVQFSHTSSMFHNQVVYEVMSRESESPAVPPEGAVGALSKVVPYRESPVLVGPLRTQRFHHIRVRAVSSFGRSTWSRWHSFYMSGSVGGHDARRQQQGLVSQLLRCASEKSPSAAATEAVWRVAESMMADPAVHRSVTTTTEWESETAWAYPFPLSRALDGFPCPRDSSFHYSAIFQERQQRRADPDKLVFVESFPKFVAAGHLNVQAMLQLRRMSALGEGHGGCDGSDGDEKNEDVASDVNSLGGGSDSTGPILYTRGTGRNTQPPPPPLPHPSQYLATPILSLAAAETISPGTLSPAAGAGIGNTAVFVPVRRGGRVAVYEPPARPEILSDSTSAGAPAVPVVTPVLSSVTPQQEGSDDALTRTRHFSTLSPTPPPALPGGGGRGGGGGAGTGVPSSSVQLDDAATAVLCALQQRTMVPKTMADFLHHILPPKPPTTSSTARSFVGGADVDALASIPVPAVYRQTTSQPQMSKATANGSAGRLRSQPSAATAQNEPSRRPQSASSSSLLRSAQGRAATPVRTPPQPALEKTAADLLYEQEDPYARLRLLSTAVLPGAKKIYTPAKPRGQPHRRK